MIVTCPHCGKAWQPESREIRRQIERLRAVQAVFDQAGEMFDTDTVMIKSGSKIKRHTHARQWAALRLRKMGLTLKEIGYHLGGRTHATVIHHLKAQLRRELSTTPSENGVKRGVEMESKK